VVDVAEPKRVRYEYFGNNLVEHPAFLAAVGSNENHPRVISSPAVHRQDLRLDDARGGGAVSVPV
jgi:hypothetical protein